MVVVGPARRRPLGRQQGRELLPLPVSKFMASTHTLSLQFQFTVCQHALVLRACPRPEAAWCAQRPTASVTWRAVSNLTLHIATAPARNIKLERNAGGGGEPPMGTAIRGFFTLLLGVVVGAATVLGYLETHPGLTAASARSIPVQQIIAPAPVSSTLLLSN